MSAPVKIAGFLAAVAAVFGVAVLAGRVVGPADDAPTKSTEMDHGNHGDATTKSLPEIPGGLMVSQNGYSLDLADSQAEAGKGQALTFRITGPDGEPVARYDVEHEKRLHLIAVRRDFTGFQHVHPELDEGSGAWSVDVDLTPGAWRIFADFKASEADALTLGADLAVAGDYQPTQSARGSRTAAVGPYRVTLKGDLAAGSDAKLALNVTKDGTPVTDLQPYLGAYGHLVALRAGDLAYLHVHPDGTPDDGKTEPGPDVVFYAAVPSAGTYHLYLDFRHDGVVRTAAFTVSAEGTEATPSEPEAPTGFGGHAGH
jgi:hypothetical protein